MTRRVTWFACAGLLAGCAGVPQDESAGRLQVEALAGTAGFSAATAPGATADASGDLRWWRRFDDPALAEWVERALAGNLDIAIAAERARQAGALLREVQAARSPQITGEGEVAWRLRSSDGRSDAGSDRRVQPGAVIGLEFDLDPWGRLRAAERAATAGLLRGEELAQAARLSTASLAARAYVEWQRARAEQQLLQDTVAVQREALRIVSVRVDAGLSPVLDRERARAELSVNEAALAAAVVRAGQALSALQVAAGVAPRPGPFTTTAAAVASPEASLPVLAGAQPLVRPLDLLRLRPDLRAAEQAMREAAAEVGVAEAELLPRLRLPGTVVFGATASGGVLGLASATLAAALDVTLFDGGARAARRDAAHARLREAALAWQRSLLLALQQVEDALLAQQGADRRIASGVRGRDAARAAQAQADTLYRAGLTNYLDVVEAQRSALAAQRQLLQAQADAAAASVGAFEAMGFMPLGSLPRVLTHLP